MNVPGRVVVVEEVVDGPLVVVVEDVLGGDDVVEVVLAEVVVVTP